MLKFYFNYLGGFPYLPSWYVGHNDSTIHVGERFSRHCRPGWNSQRSSCVLGLKVCTAIAWRLFFLYLICYFNFGIEIAYCLAHTELRTQFSCLSPGILGPCVYSHDQLDFGCYNALYSMFRLSYHSIGLGLCMRSEKAPGAFHRLCLMISFIFCPFFLGGGQDTVSL